jgi:hypothetical protein
MGKRGLKAQICQKEHLMPETSPAKQLLCCKCNIPLEIGTVNFSYLGHDFSSEQPQCPQCGQVYLSEDLVKGKVNQVETDLEDK